MLLPPQHLRSFPRISIPCSPSKLRPPAGPPCPLHIFPHHQPPAVFPPQQNLLFLYLTADTLQVRPLSPLPPIRARSGRRNRIVPVCERPSIPHPPTTRHPSPPPPRLLPAPAKRHRRRAPPRPPTPGAALSRPLNDALPRAVARRPGPCLGRLHRRAGARHDDKTASARRPQVPHAQYLAKGDFPPCARRLLSALRQRGRPMDCQEQRRRLQLAAVQTDGGKSSRWFRNVWRP